MAKSIRSKRMRKLRAIKRIRYGEKELARLKNMLEKAAAEEEASKKETEEAEKLLEDSKMEVEEKTMVAVDTSETKKTPKQKYPCWLSHFKIKKLAKQERRRKRKEVKRIKKQTKLGSRQRKKKTNRV